MQAGQGVGDGKKTAWVCIALELVFTDHRGDSAFFKRLLDKIVAIHALALYREKQLSRLNRARVDRISLGNGIRIEPARGGEELGNAGKRELHTFFPAATASVLHS